MTIVETLAGAVEGLEEARERAKGAELQRLLAGIEAEVREVLEKAKEGLLEETEAEEPEYYHDEEAERRWRRRERDGR